MGKTNMKGDLAEMRVGAKFLEKGWYVSYPFGDDAPYDLIVDMEGVLNKVQVKHVTGKDGILKVRMKSNTGIPYKGKVDYIAIYEPISEGVYLVNPNEFDNLQMIILRLEKPKNNQTKGVIMAEQYKI